jgi:acyl transferase domain-containing protein
MQESVIKCALRDAKAGAHQLSYLEAHGTGTHLGDPIEVAALEAVMRSSSVLRKEEREEGAKEEREGEGRGRRKCLLASVKANIGHLEAAAGVQLYTYIAIG